MNFSTAMSVLFCANIVSCGVNADSKIPDVYEDASSDKILQVGGHFRGMGKLVLGRCDSACAPSLAERLILSGSRSSPRIRIGTTEYPVSFDGNVISWQARIASGPCNGVGSQIGAVTLTDTGGRGSRTNTSRINCNKTSRFCSCIYEMVYERMR